jgi:hypothetical protein
MGPAAAGKLDIRDGSSGAALAARRHRGGGSRLGKGK